MYSSALHNARVAGGVARGNGCITMEGAWLLLAFVLFSSVPPAPSLQDVEIGVIVERTFFFKRRYSSALTKSLRGVTLFDKYRLTFEIIELNGAQWSPVVILDAFTEDILAKNITALFYLGKTNYEDQNIPSEQYLMKTAEYIGVPIIAWTASQSGLFQVSR